ncbi:MAG: prolyl-tRNA synthetase associated domain-containing protein [Alphaproteobacteria bacterium]|nr:prolyl-tRNA synthetase associated domain-containing protein [Alphaproteobacteria bacterium]
MSTAPPADEAALLTRFQELGIAYTLHRHPPVHTVEESRRLRGDLPGGHCKNLFLKDRKDQLWLVVTLEEAKLDLKRLPERIGAQRLSFGSPELMRAVLGIEPGAVTPFALINDRERKVRPVFDKAMLAVDPLNFHPLHNAASLAIAPGDLLRFARACGHEPRALDVAGGG